jgi:hypothetical protein
MPETPRHTYLFLRHQLSLFFFNDDHHPKGGQGAEKAHEDTFDFHYRPAHLAGIKLQGLKPPDNG